MKKILLIKNDIAFNLFLEDLVEALYDKFVFTYDENCDYDMIICELQSVKDCVNRGHLIENIVAFAYSYTSFNNLKSLPDLNFLKGYFAFHSYIRDISKLVGIQRELTLLPFCIHAHTCNKMSRFDVLDRISLVSDTDETFEIEDAQLMYNPHSLKDADALIYLSKDDRHFRLIYEALFSRSSIIGTDNQPLINELRSKGLAFIVDSKNASSNCEHVVEYLRSSINVRLQLCINLYNEAKNHSWDTHKLKYFYELELL